MKREYAVGMNSLQAKRFQAPKIPSDFSEHIGSVPVTLATREATREARRSEDIVFERLSGEQQATILAAIKSRFLDHPNPQWWWEHLLLPQKAIHGVSAENLPLICPDPQAPVWLIPCGEDDEVAYSTTPKSAALVLGECPLFEYAVVDKDLDWIMIENHHNVFIVSGDLKILEAINSEQSNAHEPRDCASVSNRTSPARGR